MYKLIKAINMSSRVKKHMHLLQFLCHCERPQRKALLTSLNKDQINSICECIDNFLSGNVSIDIELKQKLYKKKAILRKLRDKGVNHRSKKRLLVQHGGFLPALLLPVLSVASSIIGGLLSK